MKKDRQGRTWTGRGRTTALATTCAVAVAAGVAGATIPDDGGVIHACYAKSGGTVRVIDSGVTGCSGKETALNWNVKGAKGDMGPAGPAGADGKTGPEGPAGPEG